MSNSIVNIKNEPKKQNYNFENFLKNINHNLSDFEIQSDSKLNKV